MARTAGERASVVVIGALLLTATLQTELGCDPPPSDDAVPPAVGDLLADAGPYVIVPTLEQFRTDAMALRQASADWHAGSGDRAQAQAAFLTAMATWQQAELHQLGPAASSLSALGGQDLRDEIYSWPTVNPCRIDQETVDGGWDAADYFTASLVNSYGLDALEQLVYAGPDNACPGQVDINAEGTWDALGPDEIDQRRAAFAIALIDGLVDTTEVLLEAWDPAGGDFGGLLSSPGTDGSPYADQIEALNAVFDAMFYLELVTKDAKLGEPLGLGLCTTDCQLTAESIPSAASVQWVVANLDGFELLFIGGEGAGLDDLLRDEGHGDLADRIIANTAEARALAEDMQAPIDAAVVSDPASVTDLYNAVKRITDDLKGDVVTVLSLQIPSEAAGDND